MGIFDGILPPQRPAQMNYAPGFEPIMPDLIPDPMGVPVLDLPVNAAAGAAGTTPTNWWNSEFMNSMVGTSKAPGWGGMALGAAQGLMNGYLGLQQLGIAKDTLKENKRQFQMNWDAQKQTTNTALEDRQRARVASNGAAYQSVGDYMKQNGI